MLLGVIAGLSTAGLNLSSLAVFAGALGVGVGLGLQGIVKEFVCGLALIFDPNVRVGDFVEIEGDVRGEVAEIGARATRLRTNDGLDVVVPNSHLMLPARWLGAGSTASSSSGTARPVPSTWEASAMRSSR